MFCVLLMKAAVTNNGMRRHVQRKHLIEVQCHSFIPLIVEKLSIY